MKQFKEIKLENNNYMKIFKQNNKNENGKAKLDKIFQKLIITYKDRGYRVPNLSDDNTIFKTSPFLSDREQLRTFYKKNANGLSSDKYTDYLDKVQLLVEENINKTDTKKLKFSKERFTHKTKVFRKSLTYRKILEKQQQEIMKENEEIYSQNKSLKKIITENKKKFDIAKHNLESNNKTGSPIDIIELLKESKKPIKDILKIKTRNSMNEQNTLSAEKSDRFLKSPFYSSTRAVSQDFFSSPPSQTENFHSQESFQKSKAILSNLKFATNQKNLKNAKFKLDINTSRPSVSKKIISEFSEKDDYAGIDDQKLSERGKFLSEVFDLITNQKEVPNIKEITAYYAGKFMSMDQKLIVDIIDKKVEPQNLMKSITDLKLKVENSHTHEKVSSHFNASSMPEYLRKNLKKIRLNYKF